MSRNYERSFPVSNPIHYNLRKNSTFGIPSLNTIFKGKESVSNLEIKSLESLAIFKKNNQEIGTTKVLMQAL